MQFEHGGNVHRFIREQAGSLDALLDFSANINPLGLSPKGKEAMLKGLDWLSHYPDPEYTALREKLSLYYKVAPKFISVFNGGAEGIHELFRFLQPKKAVLTAPSFVEYEKALLAHGTDIEWFYLKPEQQFQLDQQKLLMTVELERPDLVVLCTPNNPTGQIIASEFLEDLTKILARWKGRLVIDEAFVDFLPTENERVSKWLPLYENVYVLKSFTKFFGVPGLRLGAVLSANSEFHEHLNVHAVPWRINVMAEQYALGALEDQTYIEATRAYIGKARPVLMQMLSSVDGIQVYDSCADYMLLKIDSDKTETFEQSLLAKQILVRNCANYRGLGPGYFRVAVKAQSENDRLVEAVKEVLR